MPSTCPARDASVPILGTENPTHATNFCMQTFYSQMQAILPAFDHSKFVARNALVTTVP
jgi:hypothetical protein